MRKFGTDGVRGLVGFEPITWSSLGALALALSHFMVLKEKKHVCIAFDTRETGRKIAMQLCYTFQSMGLHVHDCGVLPTGVLAWTTEVYGYDVGVMITASHNPACDNGIKLIDDRGSKWDEVDEFALQTLWSEPLEMHWDRAIGNYEVLDAHKAYLQWITMCFNRSLKGMIVVVDLANGAACPLVEELLEHYDCVVHAMNNAPSGFNINDKASCLQPEYLSARVLECRADIGVAFDGDADRLVVVDNKGDLWDGDALLYLLIHADLQQGITHNGVVLTTLSNEGLVESLQALQISTYRAQVGDKFVARALQSLQWELGGEPCGHMIDRRVSDVSDPVAIMMRILQWLKQSKVPLSQAPRPHVYPQCTAVVCKGGIMVEDILAFAHENFSYVRWVIRASGTESVIRIMGEYKHADQLDRAFQSVIAFANNGIV